MNFAPQRSSDEFGSNDGLLLAPLQIRDGFGRVGPPLVE